MNVKIHTYPVKLIRKPGGAKKMKNFEWGHSDVLALAKEGCTHCQGSGLRYISQQGQNSPCNCVFRAIFRACYRKFRYLAQQEKHVSRVRLEQVINGKEHRQTWGMKDEEYMADFLLVTRRNLNDQEYRLFSYHYLLGADWKLCCRRLGMERGDFFHEVYRIQRILGRVYRELEPYALFPLDEYFGGSVNTTLVKANVIQMPPRRRLMPPIRKAA
jgi:hypothetical protein